MRHKHSYEDILRAVGEFGPWQFKKLLVLWLIMLMAGAQYSLVQFYSSKRDEFICDPPETANCTLNMTLDGRVIANGSNWRFAENSSVSLDDKVNRYNYHHVFPGFYRLHHKHPNNDGYGNGLLSKDLFLTKIQEAYMTNMFCRVHHPFKDDNGNCFWNESSIAQEGDACRILHVNVTLKNQNFYYKFNNDISMSTEFRLGLICMNHLERSLLNAVMTGGMIVGCFIFYILAENFGRRFALAIIILGPALAVSGDIIAQTWYQLRPHYSAFYIYLFFMTYGKLIIVQVSYIYLVEIGGFRKKLFSIGSFHFTYISFIGTSFAIPFYLGEILGGYTYFNLEEVWIDPKIDLNENERYAYEKAAIWVRFFFYVVPVVTLLLLPESPWWLLRKGYYGRAKEVLTEMAKENRQDVDIEIYPVSLNQKCDYDGAKILRRIFVTFKNPDKANVDLESRNYTLSQTFSCPELATISLSFVTCWFMKALTDVVVEYHDTSKQENSEFFVRCTSQILGIVLLMFFENIFGRRGCLLFLQIYTAIELLRASVYTHHATSPEYDRDYRKREEESCLYWLATAHAPTTSILFWYCLSIYPISMR